MKSTVLVVDDSEDMRAILRVLLRRAGIAVAEACDGLEALESLRDHVPDLVLLDLDMPRLDGFGFLEQRLGICRQQPPVVVLTARDCDESRARALSLGALDYVVKTPQLLTNLVPSVSRWTGNL